MLEIKDIDKKILTFKNFLVSLEKALLKINYRFRKPKQILVKVNSRTDRHIKQIKEEFGAFPYALEAFYKNIGGVNFCGSHSDWGEDLKADPILIFPIKDIIRDLKGYHQDESERQTFEEYYGNFVLYISHGAYEKIGVSGSGPYYIRISDQMDPMMEGATYNKTFLGYLDLVMESYGFPGLKRKRKYKDFLRKIAIEMENEENS